MTIKCPNCKNSNVRKASKLAYIDGVYFCLDCAIYFPNNKLKNKLKNN